MQITKQLALHLHQVFFGGNWTWSNLKDQLEGVTWQLAVKKVDGYNTIAALTYHIYYYIEAISSVLDGNPLNAKDKYSFDHPPFSNQEEWDQFKTKVLSDALQLCDRISTFSDDALGNNFVEEKYGSYLRNFMGLIEHTHYHLGQIVIIKKMITEH